MDNVSRLKLKWAFGFAGAISANAQPTVVGDRVFIGGGDRNVHALDARTGCVIWEFQPDAPVRTAIMIGRASVQEQYVAYFGDVRANAYAVDVATGGLLWKLKLDEHPAARVTDTPTLYSGIVYVPVSSIEEATGASGDYRCCSFRGSVVALDARTGARVWKTFTFRSNHNRRKRTRSVRNCSVRRAQRCGRPRPSMWREHALRRHRQQLFESGRGYQRRGDRPGPEHRPDAVAPPTHR